MTIAIDYDGTYSRFPEQFNVLRESFQKIGAKVCIVTARCKQLHQIEDDLSAFDEVIYTCNQAKAEVVEADIFIDDNPITLCCTMTFDGGNVVDAKPASNLYQLYNNDEWRWHWTEDRFIAEKIDKQTHGDA